MATKSAASNAPPLTFDPLEFFKEEVRHDEQIIRLSSMKRTRFIASALGPRRTAAELVPFLFDTVKHDVYCNDDEFLFRATVTFVEMMDYVNGQHHVLIAPLEWLSSQEETVIRDKAIEGLGIICQANKINVQEEVAPVLLRLSTNEWFTARLSVCALFPHVYVKCGDPQKEELRKTYTALCADETPMVRRSAAMRLKDFVAVLDKQSTISDILPVYKQLAQDDTQDIIRVACVLVTLVLLERHFKDADDKDKTVSADPRGAKSATLKSSDENMDPQVLLHVITNASEDRSWRVRLTVAQNYDKICACMSQELISAFLLNPFVALIKDSEQEVRSAAVTIIGEMVKQNLFTTEQLQNFIVPQFQSLSLNSSPLVRAALANIISLVSKQFGRDLTQRLLLTAISDLMKDEYHDVRLNIVSHAAEICEVLGLDVLAHSLLTTIQGLIMDNQWRIRKSVILQIPSLAKQFGPEMFATKLESLFLSSLSDSVHAVRTVAISNIRTISEHFGREWTIENLMPKITEQYSLNTGFSTRLTILHSLPNLAHVMTPEQAGQYIIPLITKAARDAVPNVRFCALNILMKLVKAEKVQSITMSGTIKPVVTELVTDTDLDVAQFATLAYAYFEKGEKMLK